MNKKRTLLNLLISKKASKQSPPMNKAAVAQALGVSPSSLAHQLSGRRGISLEEARSIALFLGMTLDLFWEVYSYDI